MYAYIEGNIAQLEPTHTIIDVHGVGYLIRIPVTTFDVLRNSADKKARVYVHHHVTEDAHTLFGFATEEDKLIFQTLISVSGVGPSIGLMALSQMKGREVATAISTGNAVALTRIKGLGAKTAQRLTLELKTRMLKVFTAQPGDALTHGGNNSREEALTALVTLGITKTAAEKTLDTILKTDGPDQTVEDLIRKALRR